MKTAVDKVKKGKGRIVNARFSAMCSHYLFDPDFCNVASGWEKVVVEKNVQDSRRRIWIEAASRRFGSFAELNAWLAVDLVLEGATPNGSVSAEHVRNVLARLNAPPRPEHAKTTLQLTNLPLADTARYDRLRPTHNDNQGVIHV